VKKSPADVFPLAVFDVLSEKQISRAVSADREQRNFCRHKESGQIIPYDIVVQDTPFHFPRASSRYRIT